MMRWTNGTTGWAASVIGAALGLTACGGNDAQQGQTNAGLGGSTAVAPGAGGSTTAPVGGGAGPSTVPTGGGAGPSTVPTSTGTGGVPPVGAGGVPPVSGGGAPPVGMGGTPPGGGGDTSVGQGGAPAGGSTGTGDPSMGCGQGTFCQEASDLAPPAPADGYQIVTPSTMSIAPGSEQFWCYYKTIPGQGEVDIGGFRSWMTKGNSHHFITFHTAAGGADGSLVSCPFGSGDWVYATSKSGLEVGMDMPANVGLPYQAGSQFILNMHIINTTSDVVKPVVKLNVLFAKDVKYRAGSVFSLGANAQIAIPPFGTQTVRGSCSAPAGSNFFLWTTHSHKWTTADDVNLISGGQTTNLVHTTDWENPGTHIWQAPNFLTTKAGDSFTYSCSYKNTGATTITFGETAAFNEMCLAIGYYFPAGAASCL